MGNSDEVTISFLGGLGQIGRNCMLIEQNNEAIMIDCGIMFPTEGMPGIELILPNLERIREVKNKLKAILITHGHEDHLGAISYLDKDITPIIYSSKFANEILREKMGSNSNIKLVDVYDYQKIKIESFEVEFIPITHSVPMAFSIMIYTSQGPFLHTGDFKIDLTPIDNRLPGLSRIAELARKDPIRILFSDSTNAEREGFSRSESEVAKSLEKIMASLTDKRIIFSCFSSHIHRISEAVSTAVTLNRKVCLLGRSLQRNIKAAKNASIFGFSDDYFVDASEISSFKPGEIMVILTGSQGEPFSMLNQIISSNQMPFKLSKDDAVIISAQPIPGREKRVANLINSILEEQAEVYYSTCDFVHESGHGKAKELALMIQLTNPEYFIPVHGEYKHLKKHVDIAKSCGIDQEKCLIYKDGDVIKVSEDGIDLVQRRGAEYYYVDSAYSEIDQETINERLTLSRKGVLIVIVAVTKDYSNIIVGPEVITKAVVVKDSLEKITRALARTLDEKLEQVISENESAHLLNDVIIQETKTFLSGKITPIPIIVPVVVEIQQES